MMTDDRSLTLDSNPMPEADNGDHRARHHHHHAASYDADKARILARLRRIEGQVRGVHKMVEEDKYCVDVLTQISAIVAGLRATGQVVLEDHIRGCVLGATPDEREEVLEELMTAIERFNRSVG
jgi:CsoR family transcriptional regulator, copper-sensing transcriptional repressor